MIGMRKLQAFLEFRWNLSYTLKSRFKNFLFLSISKFQFEPLHILFFKLEKTRTYLSYKNYLLKKNMRKIFTQSAQIGAIRKWSMLPDFIFDSPFSLLTMWRQFFNIITSCKNKLTFSKSWSLSKIPNIGLIERNCENRRHF